MKRWVKLFEEFGPEPNEDALLGLLKSGRHREAKQLLREIVASSEENRDQYERMGQPTIELEEACGISGVSKVWNMPFEMTAMDAEFLFRLFLLDGLDGAQEREFLYSALLAKNPDLVVPREVERQVERDQIVRNLFVGCTSAMRLDDMLFYITATPEILKVPSGSRGYVMKVNGSIDEEYSDLYTRAQKATGYNVGWCPCTKTLNLILDELSATMP